MSFQADFKPELELIDTYFHSVFRYQNSCPLPELERFWQSLTYSFFSDGKRFRPLLAVLTAKALGRPPELTLTLAAAVELIHTYSLIHDDLPCMDNDDLRRGKPTNHKVFGEAGALLAGDGLLTMAFGVLAQAPSPNAATAVALLSTAAGPRGMVGGQALDIESAQPGETLLTEIHQRKTGALIRVSVEAAAVLCGADAREIDALRTYGEHLGMAFQLADDLQDHDPEKPEKISFTSLLGITETLKRLERSSQAALDSLVSFPDAWGLRRMVQLNRERV
ncbi:MAG: polyprenyl synthetase family protein [Bdellovibrionales bacterium]|nr:polyprenyl synthetase family protein [Bdellovibrionales bacterium]